MRTLASLALLILLSQALTAEEVDLRRHVQVEGTATLTVDPDLAVWSIQIRGQSDSLGGASDLMEKSVAQLKKKLSDAGFEGDILRVSTTASGRHYEGSGDSRVLAGFYAQRNASLTLTELDRRPDLESLLLSDDRIEITGVQSKASNFHDLREQAFRNAAAAAREKATNLATELGAELGPVLSIRQDNTSQFGGFSNDNRALALESGFTQMEKLRVSATVTVKFELQ